MPGFGPIRSGTGCAIVVAVVALSVSPAFADAPNLAPLDDLKKKKALVRDVVHRVVETVVASQPVKDAVDSTLNKLEQAVDGSVGQLTGASDGPNGRIANPRSRPSHSPRRDASVSGANSRVPRDRAGSLETFATARTGNDPSATHPAGRPPTGDRDGAIEAARRIAFPLLLALGVAAFLMVQDRLDRRDPKLRLAPVEPLSSTVMFR